MSIDRQDRRRGRPRPIETQTRDQEALGLVRQANGAMTRDTLAEELGVPPTQAYLALYRLRAAGLVECSRTGKSNYRWKAISGPGADLDGPD